ncbi:MAG: GTP-binding protein [Bacteroidia bacterium]|nr:GTP-binding protein [Bacteroidia bacterium]
MKSTINKKIALLGSHGVGKTSLISRFVEGIFPEKYLSTIGLKVDNKEVDLGDTIMDLVIWDIAGQDDPTRIPHYYLNGCHGYIYVVDLSRPSTFEDMISRMEILKGMLPKAEYVLAGNKMDLLSSQEQEDIKEQLPIPLDIYTSAKTGEFVEDLFTKLAQQLLQDHGN